jgi:hypothetical protein
MDKPVCARPTCFANSACVSFSLSSSSAEAAKEGSEIISEMRNLRAASMMYFADEMDNYNMQEFEREINTVDSINRLLSTYMENPWKKIGSEYSFKAVGERWFVECNLSGKPKGVKEYLRRLTRSAGLLNENLSDYSGGNRVLMVAR